jgi:hypothetical protein
MRRSRAKFLIMSVLALALVLGAAACGSKKSTTTTTTTAATTTTTAETTTSETTTAETTTTAAGTTTTAGGLGGIATSANCQALANLSTALSSALTGGNADIEKEVQILQEFADKAPAEIRADFQTFADAMKKIADVLKGVHLQAGQVPDAATLAKLQQLGTQIDEAKLAAAAEHIAAWAAQNCHA